MDRDSHPSPAQLFSYLDGELPPHTRAPLAEHLAGCAPCREQLNLLDRTMQAVLQAHRCTAPGNLQPFVAPESRPARSRRPFLQAAAAVAVLAFGSLALFSLRPGDNPSLSAEPRPSLTPGETVATDARRLCAGAPFQQGVPDAVTRQVLRAYGIAHPRAGMFEVDYLITPELGGVASIHNLWPEPYQNTVWNAHVKDQLESHLHNLVCSGELDLPTAQREIATDWIAAYKKYFHRAAPPASSAPVASFLAFLRTSRANAS